MGHIIINPSLSTAIGYQKIFNPAKFAVVIAILEPANSTRTDNSRSLQLFNLKHDHRSIAKQLHLQRTVQHAKSHTRKHCNKAGESGSITSRLSFDNFCYVFLSNT